MTTLWRITSVPAVCWMPPPGELRPPVIVTPLISTSIAWGMKLPIMNTRSIELPSMTVVAAPAPVTVRLSRTVSWPCVSS